MNVAKATMSSFSVVVSVKMWTVYEDQKCLYIISR